MGASSNNRRSANAENEDAEQDDDKNGYEVYTLHLIHLVTVNIHACCVSPAL
jgi:hypothetical protein